MKKYIVILNWALMALVSFIFILPITLLFFGTEPFITLPMFLIGSGLTFTLALVGVVLESLYIWNNKDNLTKILRTPSAIALFLFLSVVIYYYVLQS